MPPDPGDLAIASVPASRALVWYGDAMRLWKRGPVTLSVLAVLTVLAQVALELVPDAGPLLAQQIVAFVQQLRAVELYKLPGIAETIEWTRALMQLDTVVLDPAVIQHTLGVLLKYQDDIVKVQGSEVGRILDTIRSQVR